MIPIQSASGCSWAGTSTRWMACPIWIRKYTLFSRVVDGVTWIVAKKGFELIAVISRIVVHDERTQKTLQDVLAHIRADAERIQAEEAARDGEQQHI